jgi:adenylosuccinate synthase
MDALPPDEAVESARDVARRLAPWVADTTDFLLRAWGDGRRILLEGAQAFGLDVDHGSYPYVTSSHTGADGVSAGTGLPPRALDRVLGIVKAYTTRVGAGPFPTRDVGPAGRHLASRGREFGSTTGRPRDCGWFDAVVARRAAATQGVDAVALMKLDVLSGLPEVRVCTAYEIEGRRLHAPPAHAADWEACRPVYETFPGWADDLGGARRFQDLPAAAQRYVRAVQDVLQVRIEMVSVGPERDQFIGTSRGIPVPV